MNTSTAPYNTSGTQDSMTNINFIQVAEEDMGPPPKFELSATTGVGVRMDRQHARLEGGRFSMNVYIWQRIKQATNSYHTEGGVVVFADSLDRAKELALVHGAVIPLGCEPDEIRQCAHGAESVYIFPDAGCC